MLGGNDADDANPGAWIAGLCHPRAALGEGFTPSATHPQQGLTVTCIRPPFSSNRCTSWRS